MPHVSPLGHPRAPGCVSGLWRWPLGTVGGSSLSLAESPASKGGDVETFTRHFHSESPAFCEQFPDPCHLGA